MIIERINQLRKEHQSRSLAAIVEVRMSRQAIEDLADETYMTHLRDSREIKTLERWRAQVMARVKHGDMRLYGIPLAYDAAMPDGVVALHSDVATHVSTQSPDGPATTTN